MTYFSGGHRLHVSGGDGIKFYVGMFCHVAVGSNSMVTAESECTIMAGESCEITCGHRSIVIAGGHCLVETGRECCITMGNYGRVSAGEGSTINIMYRHDGKLRVATGCTGDTLEPQVLYRLNKQHQFEEVTDA